MNAHVPQGIEVLVKKASIDPAFKASLLERGAAAAEEIGLRLEPAEAMMLAAAPREQLEAIIARTSVPQEHRRAFLGKVAAAMLAALGAVPAMAGQSRAIGSLGHTIGASGGVRPGRPSKDKSPEEASEKAPADEKEDEKENGKDGKKEDAETRLKRQVTEIVAKQFKVSEKDLKSDALLIDDLQANSTKLYTLRRQLEQQFKLTLPRKDFLKVRTVGDVINCVKKAIRRRDEKNSNPLPSPTRGVQPDRPPSISGSGGIRP